MSTFKTAQPFTDAERAPDQPTLEGAFRRFESKIARRRRRRGLHQSYLVRATPETRRIQARMLGEKNEDVA